LNARDTIGGAALGGKGRGHLVSTIITGNKAVNGTIKEIRHFVMVEIAASR
jgi:hypothetical protein